MQLEARISVDAQGTVFKICDLRKGLLFSAIVGQLAQYDKLNELQYGRIFLSKKA